MQWTPAQFYDEDGALLRCTLCPHECALQEGEVGACHVRRRNGRGMETATFATAVRHIDAIERKPLYHYRPGTRVITIAAPGCSFTCLYCQNYRISQFGRSDEAIGTAETVDPEGLAAEAARQGAAIGMSYSEPSLAAELTLALAHACRDRGVDLLWKTNGFLTASALRESRLIWRPSTSISKPPTSSGIESSPAASYGRWSSPWPFWLPRESGWR